MIILNNKKFAKSHGEYILSLYKSGGTCVGYYQRYKRKILLYDSQNNVIGFINNNKVIGRAKKTEDGIFYNYGDIDILGNYSVEQQYKDYDKLVIGHDKNGYFFK